MTLANNWGYVPNDKFKSPAKIIHTLIEVVAKGGSLLLGIGPKPDGSLPHEAVQALEEIGKWMNMNGTAIYNTRTTKDFKQDSTFFTQNEKSGFRYALVCLKENEPLAASVTWKNNIPQKGTKMKLLQTGETVSWKQEGDVIKVMLPASFVKRKGVVAALALEFLPAK